MTARFVREAPRGVPLRRVLYGKSDWDGWLPRCEGFDAATASVTLDFGATVPYTLRWRAREPFECLTTRPQDDDGLALLTRTVDVSGRWGGVLGAQVVAQHLAWRATESGLQPWSSRLDFDNGRRLGVCLGELSAEGVPSYLPDALLVTGSEEHATAYRPPGALASAWCDG